MKILQELNKITEELNAIKEPRPEARQTHYTIRKNEYGYEVHNNFAGITMASGLSLDQAQNVFEILNRVKRR